MTRITAFAIIALAAALFVTTDNAESRTRRWCFRCIPMCPPMSAEASKTVVPPPKLTVDVARKALIDFLASDVRVRGSTLLNSNKDRIADELRKGKGFESDGYFHVAGFSISIVDPRFFAFKAFGAGFFEDYRGEFVFDGSRWTPTIELTAIGHFRDKDGKK